MSEEEYKKAFSKNLRKYTELNGKVQSDLVKDLGFNKSTVSTWFNGKKIPRMDKIDVLCDYFGISRSDLIDDKQSNESDPHYYLNDETKQIAQEIYENPNLRILFDASKNATPEDLKFVTEMVKRMKGDD